MPDADRAGQGSSAFRAFLRELPDDIAKAREAGLPVVLERTSPLTPHAQRLMDTLGVEVRIVTTSPAQLARQGRLSGRGMGHYIPIPGSSNGHEPRADWIDFRASRGRVFKRRDAGETVEVCDGCDTELDVDDVVHSPKCPVFLGEQPKTKAADWDQNAAITAIRLWADQHDGQAPSSEDWRRPVNGFPSYGIVVQLFGSWNDAVTAAGFEPRASHRERLEEREPEADGAGMRPAVSQADREVEPASRSSSRNPDPERETMTICKIEGCENDASDAPKAGPTARMCATHRAARSAEISAARTGKARGAPKKPLARTRPAGERSRPAQRHQPTPASNGNGSHASKAERLLAAARAVDEIEAQLAAARDELKEAAAALA